MKRGPTPGLIERLDLARALEALGLEVKQQGDQLQSHCPRTRMHEAGDRHASWSMRVRGQPLGVFGCWSCGYTGTITTLAREMLGFKPDADGWAQVETWLIEHADRGVIPEAERIEVKVRSSLLVHKEVPIPSGVHVDDPPMQWPMPPRRYLQKRGVSAGDVVLWGLGWAGGGRCAGRIWIPVRALDGRLAGYTARAFDGREPRYLCAKEDAGADGTVLFGEHLWPELARRDIVRVAEGEFNAIAAQRFLRGEVAAIGGVQKLCDEHLLKLSTFPRIIGMGDPDRAGRDLNQRLREAFGRKFEWMNLPDGFDVAKLAHENLPELKRRAESLAR